MSVYEQIKSDLGYLKLDAAAGAFAMLAEQAKAEGWSHIEFLARLVAEQATADRDRAWQPGCVTRASLTGARSRTSTTSSNPPSTAN